MDKETRKYFEQMLLYKLALGCLIIMVEICIIILEVLGGLLFIIPTLLKVRKFMIFQVLNYAYLIRSFICEETNQVSY